MVMIICHQVILLMKMINMTWKDDIKKDRREKLLVGSSLIYSMDNITNKLRQFRKMDIEEAEYLVRLLTETQEISLNLLNKFRDVNNFYEANIDKFPEGTIR